MKNEQRKRIVIASLLKPVDDTRMFEKMGVCLADSGRYEVYLIGFPTLLEKHQEYIHFITLRYFKRISFKRFFASLKVFREILKVKPEALVINTHELLIVAVLNRILFGTKILYDIQENYYRNLLHTSAFPPLFRVVLALWVRLKEKVCVPFFHGSFLAEKGYEKEMDFFGSSYSVIENKAVIPDGYAKGIKRAGTKQLLFSGTLAESTGVFRAIDLAKTLHKKDPKIQLKIIGYCAQEAVLNNIRRSINYHPYIQLVGGDHLVPHDQIVEAIQAADFGIISYPFSEHTRNSLPTKLYEYLALQLPILLEDYQPWTDFCSPCQAALSLNFENLDADSILSKMEAAFYTSPPENVTWDSEAKKFLTVFENLLK